MRSRTPDNDRLSRQEAPVSRGRRILHISRILAPIATLATVAITLLPHSQSPVAREQGTLEATALLTARGILDDISQDQSPQRITNPTHTTIQTNDGSTPGVPSESVVWNPHTGEIDASSFMYQDGTNTTSVSVSYTVTGNERTALTAKAQEGALSTTDLEAALGDPGTKLTGVTAATPQLSAESIVVSSDGTMFEQTTSNYTATLGITNANAPEVITNFDDQVITASNMLDGAFRASQEVTASVL